MGNEWLTMEWDWGGEAGDGEERMIADGPAKPDMRLLMHIINVEFLRELERRGYDLRTLLFRIRKQTGAYDPPRESQL